MSKRILLIRPDGIGDFVIFSGLLEKYVELYKEYKIDLICDRKNLDLAQTIPLRGRVIGINYTKLFQKKRPFYTVWLLLKLWPTRYEKVIYPVYSRERIGDLLVRFIRAKEKLVFDGDNCCDPEDKRILRNKYFTKIIEGERIRKSELERNAEFIIKLGAAFDLKSVAPKVWFAKEDSEIAERLLDEMNLIKKKYICIFPGAGSELRYWDKAKWIQLIYEIFKYSPDFKIVFLGFAKDIVPIQGILDEFNLDKERIVNLYGKTKLRILAKIIEFSCLYVGMETGATHIAAAVRTPNVCIVGGGHFGRFYPYEDLDRNRIIYKTMDCYYCNWNCIFEYAKCIKEIDAIDVLNEIKELLFLFAKEDL